MKIRNSKKEIVKGYEGENQERGNIFKKKKREEENGVNERDEGSEKYR